MEGEPGLEGLFGVARDPVHEPRKKVAISNARHVRDSGSATLTVGI